MTGPRAALSTIQAREVTKHDGRPDLRARTWTCHQGSPGLVGSSSGAGGGGRGRAWAWDTNVRTWKEVLRPSWDEVQVNGCKTDSTYSVSNLQGGPHIAHALTRSSSPHTPVQEPSRPCPHPCTALSSAHCTVWEPHGHFSSAIRAPPGPLAGDLTEGLRAPPQTWLCFVRGSSESWSPGASPTRRVPHRTPQNLQMSGLPREVPIVGDGCGWRGLRVSQEGDAHSVLEPGDGVSRDLAGGEEVPRVPTREGESGRGAAVQVPGGQQGVEGGERGQNPAGLQALGGWAPPH